MDRKKNLNLSTAHIARRETVASKRIQTEFTRWCSFSPCIYFLVNEVRISIKRRHPTLRKVTLLLSKYMLEGSALIQDIVPSQCQPGFILHHQQWAEGVGSVSCAGRLHYNRRRRGKKAIIEAILQCLRELIIHHPEAASRTVPEMKTFSCTSEVVISLFAQHSPDVEHYWSSCGPGEEESWAQLSAGAPDYSFQQHIDGAHRGLTGRTACFPARCRNAPSITGVQRQKKKRRI